MLLSLLLNQVAEVSEGTDCEITSITLDSREVVAGTLFVALKGTQQHGMAYAKTAEKQGALAIIWEADDVLNTSDPSNSSLKIPCFKVANLREYLGEVADRFYGSPSASLKLIGITGTDGKTSVSHFLAQAINNCAVIGTIGIGTLDNLQKATHTTPDVLTVHKNLAQLKQQEIETVAMEVSSHALDQKRVENVDFDVAVLTNLSRDHLDYHGTLEAYAEAKEKLFYRKSLKAVVVNLDDKFGRKVADKATSDVIAYGVNDADVSSSSSLVDTLMARNVHLSSNGISADISYKDQSAKIQASVLGRFNLSNLLASLGAMLALGWSLGDAIQQLNKVETVEGRMEKVSDSDVLAVVDYAHTPNALKTVLQALREHTQNKLICVFGCGGDRDTGKRPLMAEVAEQYADVVIVTDDNPRTENPQKIMQDIVAGFKKPELALVEHDRATAILNALSQAKMGDAVLIAGKGHENVQILATGTVPFSDRDEANKVLQELVA
ncbi:MAG TPA: UDP-N-acetylmuramoyl-L-alanyl-D-glutamate--2,6-diaminopimelate ligase [Leucothrix sp.]|nr:UDP-N-acetylmuramoyl-L-alanyl-D-glutamate--2,6-diaminopimelate ligase [Leucothrix sp.]